MPTVTKPTLKPITDKDVKEYLRNPGYLKWQIVVACLQFFTFFLYIIFNITPYWVRYEHGRIHASIWYQCETKVIEPDDENFDNSSYSPCSFGDYCHYSCGVLDIDSQPSYIHCTRILMVFSLLFYILMISCGYTSAKTRKTTYTFLQEHWSNVVGLVGSMPAISGVLYFNYYYFKDKRYNNAYLEWAFFMTALSVVMMIGWFPIKVLPYSLLKRQQRNRDIEISQMVTTSTIMLADRQFGSGNRNAASRGSGGISPTSPDSPIEPKRQRSRASSLAVVSKSVFFGRRRSSAGNFNINPDLLLTSPRSPRLSDSRRNSAVSVISAMSNSHGHGHNYMSIDSRLLWTNKRPGGRRLPKLPVEQSFGGRRGSRDERKPSLVFKDFPPTDGAATSEGEYSDDVSIIKGIDA